MFWKKALFCLAMVALLAVSAVWAGHHEKGFTELPKVWESAYNKGEVATVAAMYMEDGMRLPPDMPIVEGRAAIQAQIQGGMDEGLVKLKIDMVESHVAGDMAHGRGTFEGWDADGNPLGKGKWANVSMFVDGKWLVKFDIFNYDAPMPAPE